MKQCVETRLRIRRQKENGAMAKDKKKKLIEGGETAISKPEIASVDTINAREFDVHRGKYKNWVARRRQAAIATIKEKWSSDIDNFPTWEVVAVDEETGWKAIFYIPRAELGGEVPK
jgi:hypothetical protein